MYFQGDYWSIFVRMDLSRQQSKVWYTFIKWWIITIPLVPITTAIYVHLMLNVICINNLYCLLLWDCFIFIYENHARALPRTSVILSILFFSLSSRWEEWKTQFFSQNFVKGNGPELTQSYPPSYWPWILYARCQSHGTQQICCHVWVWK